MATSESCKSKSGNNVKDEAGAFANKQYYPIASYIHSQIKHLDSLPLAIIKYTTLKDGEIDTSIVEKNDFAKVAATMTNPDLSAPDVKGEYDETSFIDATINTISLTYSAKTDKVAIRKADVLLKQDNGNVSSIYIEKKVTATDSTVLKKMLWTAGRNLQVTTIVQYNNAPEKVLQEKYVWDDRP